MDKILLYRKGLNWSGKEKFAWQPIKYSVPIYKRIKEIVKENNISNLIIVFLDADFFYKNDIEEDEGIVPLKFNLDKYLFHKKENVKLPIIFTGLFDFFNLTNEEEMEKSINFIKDAKIKEDDEKELQRIKDEREFIQKHIDPRYRFFDSSIWFRYIPLYQLPKKLPALIEEINGFKKHGGKGQEKGKEYDNTALGLYGSNGAREFREFQIRQFNNSYIARHGVKGGHAGHIVPYGFHSETKMKEWADEEYKMIKDFSWNLLLIDDFSEKNIWQNSTTKKGLIENIINIDGKPSLNIDIATTVEKGLEKVKNNYDIILLDYYFEADEEQETKEEFGEEFLTKFLKPEGGDENNDYFKKERLGVMGKHWIFPVSVYSNALGDKLRDNRITWSDDKWIFSPGADPLNTPHLFRYKLYSFMRRQLEEFSIHYKDEKGVKQLFSELERCFLYLIYKEEIETAKKIDELSINDLRKQETLLKKQEKSFQFATFQGNALEIFPLIVELGAKFKRLYEFGKGSAFSKKVIENFFFNLQVYDWEHIQNLMYLIAFGNKSHSDMIWNELNYLKQSYQVMKINYKKDNAGNESEDKFETENAYTNFLKVIAQYLSM